MSSHLINIWQIILRSRDFFSGTPFFIISYMLKIKIKSLPLKITCHIEIIFFT
jgi:hypothetical protein